MNQTLSTFLKIGVTALCIGILLFGVAFKMTDKESGEYEAKIDAVTNDVPTTSSVTP
ncbi:hypothetical protein AB3Z07_27920 (plasmid) [Metabacillus halosaccharovorans]|uniref:hypothetical protein n=1 Tax=Metabacillus halosaccharovorans TaxID=930124 RepID=UPI0015E0EA90|nr:hypothetical protein [Metabacillus halosaccharovorans]